MGSKVIVRAAVAAALCHSLLSGCAVIAPRPQGLTLDAVPRDSRGQPVLTDLEGPLER